jgi:hypothetical protein
VTYVDPFLDAGRRVLRQSTFRYDLVTVAGQVIRPLDVDRGSPPTMTVDIGQPTKRTLRGVVLPLGELADIDVIKNRLRVVMLVNGVEYRLGRYMFTSPTEEALTTPLLSSDGSVAHLDFVDQLLILNQATTTALSIGPGANLTDFLTDFLMPFPADFDITPSGQVCGPEAITWPPATNGLNIVNQVATMLGYTDLYFGNDERGKLKPMPDPLVDPVDFTMDNVVVRPSFTRSNALLDVPNRFIVVGSGATNEAIVGVYDVPNDAPHSYANQGFYVTYSETQQGITTKAQADAAAAALGRQRSFAYDTIGFATPIDPRHDHYNVVEVEHVRYLETGWSCQLREGNTMTHSARRTYAV